MVDVIFKSVRKDVRKFIAQYTGGMEYGALGGGYYRVKDDEERELIAAKLLLLGCSSSGGKIFVEYEMVLGITTLFQLVARVNE